MNKDCNICVLGGGWSNEREISLKSSLKMYIKLSWKINIMLFYLISKETHIMI